MSQRIQLLRAELAVLEAEASDPANSIAEDADTDAGEMIRELLGMRGRLDRLNNRKGRERLIELLTTAQTSNSASAGVAPEGSVNVGGATPKPDDMSALAEVDRRVGELEKLVGSSSATVDDVGRFIARYFLLLTSVYSRRSSHLRYCPRSHA